jgi:Phage protein Gp19/Gp15/Gp42
MDPYATVEDLTNFWKAPDDANRAGFLLTLASNRLRLIGTNRDVDTDAQTAANPAYASTIQWVVMEAVKRALLTPTDSPPANAITQTAGPYSENIQFTNPSGDLWFKNSELAALGLYGHQTLSTISTSARDIYTGLGS